MSLNMFKKLTGALTTERKRSNSTLGKSVSCGNISGRERPSTPPLSDFITETNNSDARDLGLARAKDWQSSSSNTRHKSRLSKTTKVRPSYDSALSYRIDNISRKSSTTHQPWLTSFNTWRRATRFSWSSSGWMLRASGPPRPPSSRPPSCPLARSH